MGLGVCLLIASKGTEVPDFLWEGETALIHNSLCTLISNHTRFFCPCLNFLPLTVVSVNFSWEDWPKYLYCVKK